MTGASAPALNLTGAVVVLDTNILDQTSLLKDPLSVSLLAYLVRLDASLGLPEVIKGEWSRHWFEHCQKKYDAFKNSREWLSGHFSDVPDFELDVEAAAQEGLDYRLTSLNDVLVEEAVLSDDWLEAGAMVIQKLPPSTSTSQQFKDSLLWRALLRLGQGQTCVLVTADKGFTLKGTTTLQPSLAAEATDHGAEIAVVADLRALLETMKAQVGPIDETIEDDWEAILEAALEDVVDVVETEGWILVGSPDTSHSVFATDDPGILAIVIDLESQVASKDDPDADLSIYVEARVSALYDLRTETLDVDIERLDIQIMTPHGDINTRVVDRLRNTRDFTLRLS